MSEKVIGAEKQGRLYVLSAPSGAGKSSVIHALLERNSNLKFSISYTTRNVRKSEQDGKDYHFVGVSDFEEMKKEGDFLEFAKVHGNYYGTRRSDTEQELQKGHDFILDLDVEGAMQLKRNFADSVLVFILPPSRRELIERLERRGDLTPEDMKQRVFNAKQEIERSPDYDYVIINNNLSATVDIIESIMLSEKSKIEYNRGLIQLVLDSFEMKE